MCPSRAPPTQEKSMELLDKLLERMSMSEAAFRFWYELFRDSYLTKFYVPSDINYVPSLETLNFVAGCPHMVQRAIIEKCALWNESSMMSSIMWEGENAKLMMEIGRQSFVLPLQFYPKTIKKALNMFRNTLMNVPKMKFFSTRIQAYWQEFIISLSHVFAIPIIEDWETYKNLCKEVIGIYSQFYTSLSEKLTPDTWEKLLDAMLSATVSIVETQGGGHDDSLLELAMRKLYFFWVTSLVPGKEMWGRFGHKLGNLLHWRGTITHWKDRLIELTQMVLRCAEDKPEPFMKPLDSPSRNNELYTDSNMAGWSYKQLFDRWHTVLGIFGNITTLADPENHRIGMSGILEITSILAESNNPPPTHPLKTLPRPSSKASTKHTKITPSNSDSLASASASASSSSQPVPCSPAQNTTEMPTTLSRQASTNLTLHVRSMSIDTSSLSTTSDDPMYSAVSIPAYSAPTSPTSESGFTPSFPFDPTPPPLPRLVHGFERERGITAPATPTADNFHPLPSLTFDPLSPRAAIPALVRLAHGGERGVATPSTPILPPRNLSPGPALAPPSSTRPSNDVALESQAARTSSPPPSLSSSPVSSFMPIPEANKAPVDTPKREEISMSILLAILPWIVESCCDEVRHASHLHGVLCAYQALCRILCAPNFEFDLEINLRFCTCLQVGFWASKEIAGRIIASSARIFTSCRPGLTTLIPEFVKQIKSLFQESTSTLAPDLEIAAASIVNSLVCYPNHFGDLGYIRFEQGNKITRFTMDEMKIELSQCLLSVLKRSNSTDSKLSALCGSCVLVLEELFNEKPRKEMISSFCDNILNYCHYPNEAIAQTALDALSTLSHSNLASVDRALISTIIMCLCDSATSLINSRDDFHGKENIILAHYWCLVEWIIPTSISPTTVPRLSTPTVLSKLLEVVELGYYGSKALHPLDFVDSNSSQKEGLFSRSKKRDNSLTTANENNNHKKSDITKKKRRDSLFETSVDLRSTVAESPKLGGRKAEIAFMVKEVFRRDKGKKEREKEREKDHVDPDHNNDDDEDEKTDSISGKRVVKPSASGHSPKVKESAETLLLCILNHYQSFPLFIGNTTTEDDTAPTLYFLHNNKAIWSFSDMRDDNNEAFTRVIIRDCTGKYVWNFKPCPHRDIPHPPPPPFLSPRRKFTAPPFAPSSPPLSPLSSLDPLSSSAPPNANTLATTPSNSPNLSPIDFPSDLGFSSREPENLYQRMKGEPPKYSAEATPKGVDMLHHFIEYLCDHCPDVIAPWLQVEKKDQTLPPSPLPNVERDSERTYSINPNYIKISSETKELLKKQANTESQFYNLVLPSTHRPQPMEKPKPLTRTSYFDTTRQFLSNFGFLSAENRQALSRLEESGKLRRNLDALDKTNERENFKVGVVYVDKGQTTQKDILANSKGSHDYTTFLQGLGWEVELATHKGFMGGLDASNGPVTVYSASSTYEIVYHVVTLMPTAPNDDTQLHKKRHIGNDNVHIVWSENVPDSYDPNTIPSQFNDAHIVIYPHSSGLCQVQIFKKLKVQFFGPLANGMLVSKRILPFLVRQTAINANKRVRERAALYNKPYNLRQTRIQEIAGTCQKTSKAFEEFFAALYKPLTPFSPSSPLLSPSDHSSSAATPVMKAHLSNSTIRSETSVTSLDDVTSLDESDDDFDTTSEGEANLSETSEGDLRAKFKVPKINIPPTPRQTQYTTQEGESFSEPLSSP